MDIPGGRGQELRLDEGYNTTLGDNDITKELVKPKVGEQSVRGMVDVESKMVDALLVVTDGELKVTRHDTLLLVVTSSVTRELEDLRSEVLKNRSEVN